MTDTTAVPTPLEMVEEVHRIPDGTRRLQITRQLSSIRVGVSQTLTFTCQSTVFATSNELDPPLSCQRQIAPGRHMVIYQAIRPATNQPGTTKAYYCAPCAIKEWARWGVCEVDG